MCFGDGNPSEVHLNLSGCGKEMSCKVISAPKLASEITAAFQRLGDSTLIGPFLPAIASHVISGRC